MTVPRKYEYKVVRVNYQLPLTEIEEAFQALGEVGWQLTHIAPRSLFDGGCNTFNYVFVRSAVDIERLRAENRAINEVKAERGCDDQNCACWDPEVPHFH